MNGHLLFLLGILTLLPHPLLVLSQILHILSPSGFLIIDVENMLKPGDDLATQEMCEESYSHSVEEWCLQNVVGDHSILELIGGILCVRLLFVVLSDNDCDFSSRLIVKVLDDIDDRQEGRYHEAESHYETPERGPNYTKLETICLLSSMMASLRA